MKRVEIEISQIAGNVPDDAVTVKLCIEIGRQVGISVKTCQFAFGVAVMQRCCENDVLIRFFVINHTLQVHVSINVG